MQEWRNEKTEELFNAFLKLKNVDEVANFCRDLMTEAEIEEFASRLQIAKLLNQGLSQRAISKELEVSITTVTRVNHWLKSGENGYEKVLERLYPKKKSELHQRTRIQER